MTSAPPRSLASLPPDVIYEILGFALDAPNSPHRPAVLKTCSLLHNVGAPLLLQRVRLASLASWESMLGVGGKLTALEQGGGGMGKYVKELELDRLEEPKDGWLFPLSPSLHLPNLQTLVLSHHLAETWFIDPSLPPSHLRERISPFNHHEIPSSFFHSLFVQFPAISTLRYLAHPSVAAWSVPPSSGRAKDTFRPAISTLLGLTEWYDHQQRGTATASPALFDPFPWPLLRTIHLVGALVLDDPRGMETRLKRAVAFSMLPMVETLIVEFHKDVGDIEARMQGVYASLIVGSVEEERETRWKGLKRLEVKGKEVEKGKKARKEGIPMEKRLRACWEERESRGGWDASERRLGPLVVFVDREGERKLVD